jgi:hypothetical protein
MAHFLTGEKWRDNSLSSSQRSPSTIFNLVMRWIIPSAQTPKPDNLPRFLNSVQVPAQVGNQYYQNYADHHNDEKRDSRDQRIAKYPAKSIGCHRLLSAKLCVCQKHPLINS